MNELVAFLDDTRVGRLTRDRHGRLSFAYDDAWRTSADAYPLSLSLPLTAREHGHASVETYLWGLLPDNEMILDRWAKRFQVSARNVFGMLAHIGEDCPGAVWFVSTDRAMTATHTRGSVDWLSESDVAERLRALRRDVSAWRNESDAGQFSLGGAQGKTALVFDGKRWGVPSGRRPTTHILKPGIPDLDGHAINEHFCLCLARECGIPVATSHIARFDDEIAVAIERYDRIRSRNAIVRVHQEDLCQALGVPPSRKYESDGGPGVRAIGALLREASSAPGQDVATFIDAIALAWFLGGTDAHAKNYSILIGRGGHVRLAPLYDIASALPYFPHSLRKLKLAMKIGGRYRLNDIGGHSFERLAADLRVDPEQARTRVREMAGQLPDAAQTVTRALSRDRFAARAATELADLITGRARECARKLD